MKYTKFLIVALIFTCVGFNNMAFANNFEKAEGFLADRTYAEAITVLQALLEKDTKNNDYLLYLMGNAFFYQQEYKNAIKWYKKLSNEYPESSWKQKALFKQADCYMHLQHFEQAEAIYEQEVTRLVSPERKERIAEVYLNFAEEYFSGRWVKRHEQPGIEEIPDYARAKTFYELALQMEISKVKVEEVRFQIARCAFELGNYPEAISILSALQQEYPEGVYLTQVIYYLGQSYLRQGQMLQARRVFRDFIEDEPDDPKAPEAAFLLSRSYYIPYPHSAEDLELGVKSLQEYLEIYSDDERASQAEYEIGLSYYNFARYDDAVTAFKKYITKYESMDSRLRGNDKNEDEQAIMSSQTGIYLPLAWYHLGKIYQQQRKFEEAIAVWQQYLQKYPSHNQWSEVQRQIIETEYLIADKLFREAQYEAARNAWEQFLTAHPLDPRNPQIMFRIGETYVKQAEGTPPSPSQGGISGDKESVQNFYQEAIVQWKDTVSKYPNTDPASQAQYEIGHILETKLMRFEEAFEAYKQVTWGSYVSWAQERIRQMQAKRLTVLTERIFRTNEAPTLKVTTRNIETLTLKMYPVDLETYFRKMQTTAGVDTLDIALIDPEKIWQETIEGYQKYRQMENYFTIPFSKPGAYLVTCSEENVSSGVGYEATSFVLISDLDIILKTTKRDALVFAQNMKSGEAYSHVKFLLSDGNKIFFEGNTKEDGVFHEAIEELKNMQDIRVFAYDGAQYASSTLDIGDLYYVAGLESRGYIYTDRPAYRPGQQINLKGIIREVDEQGILQVPKVYEESRKYAVQIMSSQGSPVYQDHVELSDFGSFATDFVLSSVAPIGEYRILVNRGKYTYSGTFLVEEYKLEKLKLSIDTERDVYFRGETISGTIKAEYYYGEPVKEKQVSYSLANLEIHSAITNEQGEIPFSLNTRDFAESQTITLRARLDDENIQSAKTVWLATRGFFCEVNTIRNVYLVGEDIEVSVTTKDPAGKPLEKSLKLGVFKHETTVYGETAEVKIEELQLVTNKEGTGKSVIRIAEGGNYLLRVEGLDRFDNPVSGQTELFISGKDDEIMLRFITDTEEFRVGEQPEVSLFSRAPTGLGLLTYEGEAILSYQVINIQKDKNPLQLSISSELAPNFTLAVAQMDGNKFHQASKEFLVIQKLNIRINLAKISESSSDPEKEFKPGEIIVVEITTTDQNDKPISAEVSLAMVDEALYAQYAERLPSIQDFFYDQWREFVSKTDSSCIFSFSAETKEIVTELLDEEQRLEQEMEEMARKDEVLSMTSGEMAFADGSSELKAVGRVMESPMSAAKRPAPAPQVAGKMDMDEGGEFLKALREYFPETGYWNPSIVTDDTGKAIVQITLPDSTTEWRFTSRGITKKTLVGEATTDILTKLPFFAEMKVPAVFTEGDKVSVLASLHNYSGSEQEVEMTFSGSLNSAVLERQEQSVEIENQRVLETPYHLDLSDLGELPEIAPVSLELNAIADQLRDRIKYEVPVRPWGIEYVSTKSGRLQDDRKIEMSLPGDRHYIYQEMNILLNPALDRTLVDLVQDVPWPFKAPASASIHEAIAVFNAIQFIKVRDTSESVSHFDHAPEHERLQARLRSLLTEISLRQNPNGGWNWTGREQLSDLFVSADAVGLLSEAKSQGYLVRSDVLKKGIAYLKQAFQSAQDNEIKTYLLYALTIANELDFAHVNRVYRERNSLRTSGLALLTLIYSKLKRPEIAAELNALLQKRVKIQRDQATGEQIAYWLSDSPYAWLQGDVDVTALALLALQHVEPESNRIASVVDWLYTQRQWTGWGSKRSNARVSSGLLEYFSQTRYAANRYMLHITVNGESLWKISVDNEQGLIPLRVPAEILKGYDNTITFDFEGRGSVNYVCVLKGSSRDIQQTREHYEVWRYYEPAPISFKGKEIPRGFRVLDGSYSTWRNKLSQIPLGGFGRVTIEYNRRHYDREQPYRNQRLIIEESIPAGCTVLRPSIQGGFLDYEIGDGKIVFYLNNAHYGKVSYDLYGYLPGQYKVLPTKIQSPYVPELLDYGKPYSITVLERGQTVTEKYKKTPDELYYYGKALFEEKDYAEARPLLEKLFEEYRLRSEPYRDTARMLMYIAIAENNSRDIVQYFEVLKEKYPNLVLSFEDIVRVARAYRDIQEYERATHVFKATAEASFLKDVQVSGTLEVQSEFLPSVEYTKNLLMEYPDIPTTETSFYALAQLLYTEAVRSQAVRSEAVRSEVRSEAEYRQKRKELLGMAIEMLYQFLVRYPENPIADEVSFSLANAYIDLEDFETVVELAQDFQQRYPKSPYFSGYQYIEGYADFELEHYQKSLELCQKVATGKYLNKNGEMVESDYKNLAIYIMGQIYHSMGEPEKAIEEYEKVKEQFPDAKEAIEYFTRKDVKLDEVTTFKPGEAAQVTLHYRNIKELNTLAYRVDLMKLYLLQKNLNNITNINLAGITPYYQQTVQLGEGKDYTDKTYDLILPLEKEGAYLVVAKEAEFDTSGMVLLSPLKLEVEEDMISGRVRVNVLNAETGRYENNVHVKVIGSFDTEFVSGSTDLRGIFIADNIHGTATVIARKGDQYAFYRGTSALQPTDIGFERSMLQAPADMRSQATQQLRETNLMIQQQSEGYLRQNLYQNKQTGVEVQAAY